MTHLPQRMDSADAASGRIDSTKSIAVNWRMVRSIPLLASCLAPVAVLRQARLEELGDQAGPAGLVTCTDAAAGVAAEVLVEQHVVAKVRVALHLRVLPEHRPPPALVLEEQPLQARRQIVCDLIQRTQLAGA